MRRLVVVVALASAACEATEIPYAVGTEVTLECPSRPATGRRRVLVVDTQLDPTLPEIAPSIAGCYQTVCDDAGENCRIRPGVTLRRRRASRASPPDPAAWNAALAHKRIPDGIVGWIEYPILGRGPESDHGTGVASTIAYGLDDVELVLLQVPLRREDEAIACPDAARVREDIRVATDPTLRAERVSAPASPYEQDYVELLRRERVDIVNESFGASRAETEMLCPGLPWADYYEAYGRLARDRERALDASGAFAGVAVTVVKAAGNDNALVQSLRDAEYCHADRSAGLGAASKTIVVGAYAPVPSTPLSLFTNRGSCVDVYAPGERILVPDANGVLRAIYGTSFAAPLVARWIATQPREDPSATIARVKAAAEGKVLPLSLFPGGLLFDDKSTPRAIPGR